ncbi:MAG: hypothetical protein K0S74_1634 [Chlamydiales bacterium]|jgi:DUF1009 family protein|nr:hypothetical protein [Chlamydiales bacterium]
MDNKQHKVFSQQIAVLAGEGKMPLLTLQELCASGKDPFLISIKNITSPDLFVFVSEHVELYLTQLGKAIKECRKREITQLILVGRVHHKSIFDLSLLHMDWTTIKLWLGLKDKRADTILKEIAETFEKNGIHVLNSIEYLKKYLAKEGVLTQKQPTEAILTDIALGWKLALKLGELDIGQTVIIKKQSVVAIEAMEGTDQCIERAGQIAREGCVMVKTAKPQQDFRFDVPVIGLNTIQKLVKIKAAAVAIEAEKTLILDPEAIDYANQHGLVIIAMPSR